MTWGARGPGCDTLWLPVSSMQSPLERTARHNKRCLERVLLSWMQRRKTSTVSAAQLLEGHPADLDKDLR